MPKYKKGQFKQRQSTPKKHKQYTESQVNNQLGKLQGKKTAKMGRGTSIRSQPANFARESNPASLLVKIL